MFQGFPGYFEHQPLLGVHRFGLAGRDAEERRIEPIDAADEPTPARVHLLGCIRIGVVVRVDVPPVSGDLSDRVHTLSKELPVAICGIGAAGQPAADSHDGNRFGLLALESIDARLQLLERQVRVLEKRLEIGRVHTLGTHLLVSLGAAESSKLGCQQRRHLILRQLVELFRHLFPLSRFALGSLRGGGHRRPPS